MAGETQSLHPSAQALLDQFTFYDLDEGTKKEVNETRDRFRKLAEYVAYYVPSGPEQTTALRKLREAKDCAVLAVIAAAKD